MENPELKENLRSKTFTEDFRVRLATSNKVVAELKALGVRPLRTDPSVIRPVIEIDPMTAGPVMAMPISLLTWREPGGMKRHSKLVAGCEVVWSSAT